MSHQYQDTDRECGGCGATAADRNLNRGEDPQGLSKCPHCDADKCCMCDMGDDVECISCSNE